MNIDITTTVNVVLYIAYFASICGISFLGYTYLLRHNVINLLHKKNETGERFASQSKPIIGGIIFFGCVIIGFIISIFFGGNSSPDWIVLVCCIIGFGIGFVDDLKNFSPVFKLIFQLMCAIILIATDSHISTSENVFLNAALTIFWVVGIMNSINMLDNMDGVTASVSGIILTGFSAIALSQGNTSDFILLISVIAGICVFLHWNWHPSKMYMGDNGSQLLGIFLVYFSIKYVWNSAGTDIGFNYEQILLVALVFLVPLTDTATVAFNRFLAGRSPFVGDRFHTTHCLVYQGFSIKQTVILLDVITLIGTVASTCIIIFYNSYFSKNIAIVLTIYAGVVFFSAYSMNLIIRNKNNLLFKKQNA